MAEAEDVARAAADLLASVARTAEGDRPGPLHAAAGAYDRASRSPYRRWGDVSAGLDLRLVTAGVALLLRAGPSEAAQLGALVVALGGLIEAVAELRAAQDDRCRRVPPGEPLRTCERCCPQLLLPRRGGHPPSLRGTWAEGNRRRGSRKYGSPFRCRGSLLGC